jgi:glycosyltransferase involved in cell wall biosynthesis
MWTERFLPRVGGAEYYTLELARWAARSGSVDVSVRALGVAPSWPELPGGFAADFARDTVFAPPRPQRYEVHGIPVFPIRLGFGERREVWRHVQYFEHRPAYKLKAIAAVLAAAERTGPQPDVIHAVGSSPVTLAATLYAQAAGIPLVSTPLLHLEADKPALWGTPVNEIVRGSQQVLTMTEVERQKLIEEGLEEDQVRVAGGGPVLAPEARPRWARLRLMVGNAPIILFAARLAPHKGAVFLGEAMRRVWERHPRARLVMLGPYSRRQACGLMQCWDKRIVVLGEVSLQRKTDLLAAADVVCLPSTAESFGLVVVEAAWLGVPSVVSYTPQMVEIVHHDHNGLMPDRTPEGLGGALCELLDDPERCRRMGKSAQHRAREHHTWERAVEATLGAYHAVLRGEDAAPGA